MGFKRQIFLGLVAVSLTLSFASAELVAALTTTRTARTLMGQETIGNKPFDDANFKDWPYIMPVINNQSRVYHSWVNGDERFYFNSDPNKLNELLRDFAKLNGNKEVLVVPQAKDVTTFNGKQSFGFNCQLHLVGGIAKHISGKPKGGIYWPLDPQMTIHVTPKTDLKKLTIPKNVALVSLAEIKARYRSGFESTDKTVRGWGIGFLVTADPFDSESLKTVSELLVIADDWVALNAIVNLKHFGPKVKDHLPRLLKIENSTIKQNAAAAKKIIAETEAACQAEAVLEFEKKESTFRAQETQAQAFIDRVRGT